MIEDLDISLDNFLSGEATPGSELAGANISFAVPDKDWRSQGTGLGLDLYLYRVVENRELRSTERRYRTNPDGTVTQVDFPVRVECSYLVTAWNKGAAVPGVEKEKQEHRLLSQVLRVLFRNPTIPRSYLVGLLAGQELELPMVSAQAADEAANPDFWSGLETYLRPSITVKITLAMPLGLDVTGPLVTGVTTRTGGEQRMTIGGTVWTNAPTPLPIADAWVRVEPTGRTIVTDSQGRFVFQRLSPGPYQLTVRAVGWQEGSRAITVPQPDGSYDLTLLPL